MLSCEFSEIFKNTFFTEFLQMKYIVFFSCQKEDSVYRMTIYDKVFRILKVHWYRFENLPISLSSHENNMSKIHIKTPFTFWDMRTWDMWNVCLQILRNNRIRWKLAYFLRNLRASLENDSRIFTIKKTKFFDIIFMWTQKI